MKESRLQELRDSIKQTDSKLVRLLNRRAGLSREIGVLKAVLGKEVYDPSHESLVYEHLAKINGENLPLPSLHAIFREIISASRLLQSPVTVAYLGPEASFAHLAARSHFGDSSQFVPQASIARIFDEVEKGRVKWGVVPVENSLEGAVNLTLDCLMTTMLQIRAEIFLPISHCLLSNHHLLADMEKVYSHPQALAQCQVWLRANLPHAVLVAVESTAAAAQTAAREGRVAAICSRAAAELYGLDVFAEGIEDRASNTTRFLVIGTGESQPTGSDKTSLLFSTQHQSGALCRALESFAGRGINMMKIESYPLKDRLWEYYFFVDVAGHLQDKEIQQCLADLRQKTAFVKILGSYPLAQINETRKLTALSSAGRKQRTRNKTQKENRP